MKITLRRVLMSFFGVIICGASVGLFSIAAFGVDPFTVTMKGLDSVIPIDYGTLYVIVNAILLMFSLIFNRKCIGPATFINLFLLGYVVDGSEKLLRLAIRPELLALMPVRVVSILLGIVIICFASSLYMTADLGVSTYDAVAITLAYKWKLWQFRFIRIITDVVCVVSGVTLYRLGGHSWTEVTAIAGMGTIITALFMGPLVDWFNRHVAQKMLGE